MNGSMGFCDLHSHSDYSIFDAFAKLDDKIQRAKELGYTALAMTEHGTTTGLMEHYLKCQKAGLKPILGYEGYFSFEPDIKAGNTYHILLLAKDLTGYKNLMKLATYGTEHFYKKPRIGFDILRECSEGIICSTACIGGILGCENPDEIIEEMVDIFGEDFYLEIQPHDFPEQHEYNKKVLALSDKHNIKTIITGDSHYVWKEDAEVHRQWLGLGENDEYYKSGDYYMMSVEEMQEKLPFDITPFVKNALEVIEKCNVVIPLGEHNYPVFDVESPEMYIRERCREGWRKKGIGKLVNKDTYGKQVNHELKVLEQCGYMNYFCIIDDMLKWCREQGIPTGIGRGSVAGSTIAYLMDITDVDPIKYNLVFERFANPERVTDCDIDCDVASDRRDEVINYIKEKYGEVFQIRTISYISDKSAVQRAGQALGLPPSEIDKISTSINSVEEVKNKELKDLAKKFMGHIQSYGKHASAVVVFPKEVTNWCAVEKAKDDVVAAQDYHLLEKQGIMKLDILGLETLSIINNTLERIGKDINLSTIDYEDKKTGDMLRAGFTDGCFQIESQTMTNIIKDINTKTVEDIIATVALGRPGVLDAGMDQTFIKRRQGLETVKYLHPKLEPILKDTEGVILYQEQIMQIAQVLCGYSYDKADNIRRIIGRKVVDEMQPVIDEMIDAGVNNGIDKDTMTKITDEIVTFANYGFNRGHSAAYGITAWRTAWLKSHYPTEFYASLFDSVAIDKPKLASHIVAAKKMGVEVLPPDIMEGNQTCTCKGNSVILGFNCISSVGNTIIKNEDFSTPKEWLEKNSKVNKKALQNLIGSGAFDNYGVESRYELFEYVEWLKDKRKSKGEFKFTGEEGESYGTLEFNTIGYSFTDIFSEYDLGMVDGVRNFAVMVSKVKAHKTRKGKPMAFVKGLTQTGVSELVIFDKDFTQLEKGKVYIMRLDGTIIKDFMIAKKGA